MNIGATLKVILKEKDISQKELESMTHLSRTSISQIINGIKNPRQSTIETICHSLYITPGYLIARSLESRDFSDKDQIIKVIKHLLDQIKIDSHL